MVSVIVPTADGRRWLEMCLPAVFAQQAVGDDMEVVVVDDGSSDGTGAFLAGSYPQVRVVTTAGRRGFAAACNLGARTARGDLVVFLNNDTRPHPCWLSRLVAALRARADAGLASSMILCLGGQTIDSAGDGYLRCGGAFKHRHGEPVLQTDRDGRAQPRETFGACGAALLIRRSLFEQLGGFDEDYGMVHEDVDLSYRARLLGATCLFVPDAIVEHAGSASLGRLSPRAVYLGQRNLEWTYIKNTPASLLWRTLPSHVLYSVAAVIGYGMVGHGWTVLRAKLAAAAGVPAILRKRRVVQRTRRVPAAAVAARMERGWIARKRREKRFTLTRRDEPAPPAGAGAKT